MKCLPQILRYFSNLERLSGGVDEHNAADVPLAILAFLDQRDLQLKWHSTIKGIYNRHTTASAAHSESIKKSCCNEFIQFWKCEKSTQNKLTFYNNAKTEFGYEEYLSTLPQNIRCHVTRLRISAHTLKIEKGRYNTKCGNDRLLEKVCNFCTEKRVADTMLHELPFFDPIIEDELHVLVSCP